MLLLLYLLAIRGDEIVQLRDDAAAKQQVWPPWLVQLRRQPSDSAYTPRSARKRQTDADNPEAN